MVVDGERTAAERSMRIPYEVLGGRDSRSYGVWGRARYRNSSELVDITMVDWPSTIFS